MSADPFEYQLIRVNALKNAIYHSARQRVLESWSRRFNFLVVVLGATAASDVLSVLGIGPEWPAMLTAVIGAAQLVYDFSGRASRHQTLQKEYYRLLASIESVTTPTVDDCARWRGEALQIAADEPPVYHALDAKAYNQALASTGAFDLTKEHLVLPWFHSAAANWLHFGGEPYRRRCELVGAK